MGVSGRYILAAAALLLAPISAFAQCCMGAGVPSVRFPTAPSPVSGPVTGPGVGAPCCGTGPALTVPGAPILAPNLNVYYPPTSFNVVTNNITQFHGVSPSHAPSRLVVIASASASGGGGEAPLPPVTLAGAEERRVREVRKEKLLPVQAICLDDKATPHPASQTFGGPEVGEFRGEIFRCMAGTKMQVTMGRFVDGKPVFDGAAFGCQKDEALVYDGQGLACRAQDVKRPCNERSLLRRFGPGFKVVRLMHVEKVEERIAAAPPAASVAMAMDGGVGGPVF